VLGKGVARRDQHSPHARHARRTNSPLVSVALAGRCLYRRAGCGRHHRQRDRLCGVLGVLVAPRSLVAHVAGVLGLSFIAFISVADLVGLQQDGSRAQDIVTHWRSGLGWPLTVTVAATLVCAVASLIALRRRRK
jgi:hypothetical protein